MELETEHLLLRQWRESDAETLYKYASDPCVGTAAGWPPHINIDHSLEVIRKVFSRPEVYAVVLKSPREPVGCIGLVPNNSPEIGKNDAEVGYWIGAPFWGQGFTTEALCEFLRYCFEDLGYNAVWSGYYDGNDRSAGVLKKCGFTYHHTENDKPCELMHDIRTEHFMRITKKEWSKRHKKYSIIN